jgi:hypothetical protein
MPQACAKYLGCDPLDGGTFDSCEIEGLSCSRWCAVGTVGSMILLQLAANMLFTHFWPLPPMVPQIPPSLGVLEWDEELAPLWCAAVQEGDTRRLPLAVVSHQSLVDEQATESGSPPPWVTKDSLLSLMRAGIWQFEVDVFEVSSISDDGGPAGGLLLVGHPDRIGRALGLELRSGGAGGARPDAVAVRERAAANLWPAPLQLSELLDWLATDSSGQRVARAHLRWLYIQLYIHR